ncbi:hypothetical protein JAAARDRAFT_463632 [Jaapia argillacea MUCL 33604]|uniref:Pentacotripeptide-repeat region of PRORP domain-containing protein n=1 Tax=Jaapia argillacea MUCL 33604 TaxID=933084 RepID=A0A067QIV6_9AGAM|nr:hypothetical protein JAAARDRAFT_463632 [Jaapia argillacea MUCL 33604]
MSLCRTQLFRVKCSTHHPSSLVLRKLLSTRSSSLKIRWKNDKVQLPPLVAKPTDQNGEKSEVELHMEAIRVERTLHERRRDLPKLNGGANPGQGMGARKEKVEKRRPPAKADVVYTYTSIREHDRSLVATMDSSAILEVAFKASRAKLLSVLDDLAADIVDIFEGSPEEKCFLINEFLTIANHRSLLSDRRVIFLHDTVTSIGSISTLSPDALTRIADAVLSNPPSLDSPEAFSSIHDLSTLLTKFLRSPPPGAASDTMPRIIFQLFCFIQLYTRAGRNEEALHIFQVLVDTNNVSSDALDSPNLVSDRFGAIILSALIKSCLQWQWYSRAYRFLNDALNTEESKPFDAHFAELTLQTLEHLIHSTKTDRLIASESLIRRLLLRSPETPIPVTTISLFYDQARQIRDPMRAELVYAQTVNPTVRSRHQYPPPKGKTLTWLMEHLVQHSKNMHLARVLATQVVESNVAIPINERGSFIALVASAGFATQARAIWEKYSTGPDRYKVVGSSAAMLRMVSLFSSMITRQEGIVKEARSSPSAEGGDPQSTWPPAVEVEPQSQPSPTGSGEEESEGSPRNLDVEVDRLTDFTAFSARVVAEFRETLEPLVHAPHRALTSIARAYFMQRNIAAGCDVLKVLWDRREIPDLYDVNVALSALAEYDATAAANMIREMIGKGLQPDGVTFGTVLHHAVQQCDVRLVCWLIHTSREVGSLTPKGLTAVIRGSIMAELDDIPTLRTNLTRSLEILSTLRHLDNLAAPNLGKFCVTASLRADEPLLAYRFWRLLLRGKAEWWDLEHLSLRVKIAKRIRAHQKQGKVDEVKAWTMLAQLDTRRRQEPTTTTE